MKQPIGAGGSLLWLLYYCKLGSGISILCFELGK